MILRPDVEPAHARGTSGDGRQLARPARTDRDPARRTAPPSARTPILRRSSLRQTGARLIAVEVPRCVQPHQHVSPERAHLITPYGLSRRQRLGPNDCRGRHLRFTSTPADFAAGAMRRPRLSSAGLPNGWRLSALAPVTVSVNAAGPPVDWNRHHVAVGDLTSNNRQASGLLTSSDERARSGDVLLRRVCAGELWSCWIRMVRCRRGIGPVTNATEYGVRA